MVSVCISKMIIIIAIAVILYNKDGGVAWRAYYITTCNSHALTECKIATAV